jgi:integrase
MTNQASLIQLLAHVRQICEDKGLAESTITKKLFLLRLVLDYVEDVTEKELHRFFKTCQTRQGKLLSPHTRNAVRIELKWLYRHMLRQEPPPELTEVLRKESAPSRGKTVASEELQNLLAFAPSALFALAYQLLYDSGLRPHELLSLTPEHISFPCPDLALMQLPETNPKTPSGRNKTGSRSVLVQGPSVVDLRHLVQKHVAIGENYVFLFPFAHKTLSTIFCRMKKNYQASQQASPLFQRSPTDQLESSPRSSDTFTGRLYDLRHSAATRWAAAGMPDFLLKQTMGWSQASRMPNVYIHLTGLDLANWALKQRGLSPSSAASASSPKTQDTSTGPRPSALFNQLFKK